MTERRFCWGLGRQKITPAKEKEKKIERVKRRERREEKKHWWHSQFLYWLLWTLKRLRKQNLSAVTFSKHPAKHVSSGLPVSSNSKFKREQHPFLLENYMVKKRRSKAKYSYFIVRFDPLAADACTASKSKATRTCQGVLLAFKLVNLYLVVLLLTDRFCSSLNFV